MIGIRYGTLVRRLSISSIRVMVVIRAIQCEEAKTIQDTLQVQKYCSESAPAGKSCSDDILHALASLKKKECK